MDDNEINLTIAKTMLENAGLKVVTVSNGKQAIEMNHLEEFDAILMDIQMPVMDGYEATQYIRETLGLKDIPIIAVSANVLPKDIQKSLRSGMDAHIAKPLRVDVLLTTIIKYMSVSRISKSFG